MTERARSWRSETVKLALLGTAGALATGLGGCGRTDFQRNVYLSEEDCSQDYSPAICASQGTTQAGRYLGPVYRMRYGRASACRSDDHGPGRTSSLGTPRRVAVDAVQRGGFGTQCRTAGSGVTRLTSGGGSSSSHWGSRGG